MNINNVIRGLAVATCAAMSSTSFAALITDPVNLGYTVSAGQQIGWSHNLNDNPGFVLGSVLSGNLKINFEDDAHDPLLAPVETAGVTVELDWNLLDGVLGGNDDGTVTNWYSKTFTYDTGLSVTSLFNLNQDGYLDVMLKSITGDFKVLNSVLTVNTRDSAAAVPEPSSLALLAAGMIGIVMMRRISARAES